MAVTRLSVLALAALAGCFSPKYPDGLTCGLGTDPCPPGQRCQTDGRCHAEAVGADDAALDGMLDGATDAALPLWGTPVRIEELTTDHTDQDPAFDGTLLTIVFASNRPGGAGGNDLWTATRRSLAKPFENIAPITELDTAFEELHPWLSPDGQTIYFESDCTGLGDIYMATRVGTGSWSTPALVPTVNRGDTFEGGMGLTSDQSMMMLVSDRGGAGNRDLYRSIRDMTTGAWSTPILANAVSSPDLESGPALSDDELYFMRLDANMTAHIFRAGRMRVTFDDPTQVTELGIAADPWVSDDGRTMAMSRNIDPITGIDLYISTR